MGRYLITRALPEAEATARRLEALGHQALLSPLLRLDFTELVTDPAKAEHVRKAALAAQAIIFSSAAGVRAFAAAGAPMTRPAFAVGDATAALAQALGFAGVTSAKGDGHDLAALVAQKVSPEDGPVLYISGEPTAYALAADLAGQGFEVSHLILYESFTAKSLTPEAHAALDAHTLDGVLFHSPRGAGAFRSLLAGRSTAGALTGCTAFCLSRNVAAELEGLAFQAIQVAARPEEVALLSLLSQR